MSDVEAVMNHKRKSTIKIILNHYRKILKYPFGFPFDKPDLNQRVGSRKDWERTSYSSICIKHFENKHFQIRKRARLYELLLMPIISGNSDDVLPL